MSAAQGLGLQLPCGRTNCAPFTRVQAACGQRARRQIVRRALIEEDERDKDSYNEQTEHSPVSGRRLLLLAGAASVGAALPRWLRQTLDAREERKFSQALQDSILEILSTDAAHAATLSTEQVTEGQPATDAYASSVSPVPSNNSARHFLTLVATGGTAAGATALWGTQQVKSLRQELEDVAARADSADKHLSALTTQLRAKAPSALAKSVSNLQSDLASSDQQLREVQSQLASWRATAEESAEKRDQLSKQCLELQQSLKAAKEAKAKISNDLATEKINCSVAEKDAESAHAEIAQRKQAEAKLSEQLAQARAHGDDLQDEAAQLKVRLKAAIEDGDAAKSKLVAERDNSATLERARSAAIQDVRKLLSEKRELESEVASKQETIQELSADVASLRNAREQLEGALSALGTNCEELEAQLQEAAARENALLREVQQEANGHDEALESLRAVAAENSARQEKLREAMEACQHLQSELVSSQAETHRLQAQLGARDAEARELESDITTAVRDVKEALHRETQALSQAEEEREAAEEAIKRMVEAEDAMEFSRSESARLRSRLAAAEEALEEVSSNMKSDLSNTRQQLATRMTELKVALDKQPTDAPPPSLPPHQSPPQQQQQQQPQSQPQPQPLPQQIAPAPRLSRSQRQRPPVKGAAEGGNTARDQQGSNPEGPASPLMSRGQSAAAGKRAKGRQQ